MSKYNYTCCLYGVESWSLTPREEYRLRAFENSVLRGIFGPKRDEVKKLRKLHNEELNDLYCSPNIVRGIKTEIMKLAGHVARRGRGQADTEIVGDERKRPLGRHRRRWEDNIKIDLQELGRGVEWVNMAQDRDRWPAIVNAVMNLRVI
jgi:hypothetical protein